MGNNWKKKFNEAESTPNTGVWDRIAADLDAGALPAKKSNFPRYLAWAAAVAVFALSGFLTWHISNQEVPANEPAYSQAQNPSENSTSPIVAEASPLVVNDPETLAISKVRSTKSEVAEVKNVAKSTPLEEAHKPNSMVVAYQKNALTRAENGNGANEIDNALAKSLTNPLTKMVFPESIATGLPESINTELVAQETGDIVTKEIQQEKAKEEKFEYPEADDFLIEKKKSSKSARNRMWVGAAQGVGGYSTHLDGSGGAGISTKGIAPFADPSLTLDKALEDIQMTEQKVKEQMSISTGIFIGLPIANKLSIITGMTYNKSNYSSDATSVNGELLHFTAETIQVKTDKSTEYKDVRLQGTYEMAVMPILADLILTTGNFDWSVQAGPEMGLLLRQQITNDELGVSRTTHSGDIYRPVHLRVAIGSTLSYSLSESMKISFQPIIEQAVTSITTPDASFNSYPLNYSAMFGLRYSFN